jgi:Class III signal peptide
MNRKKGQGAFEYILMLSGVLLIVILIIFILQSTLSGANNSIGTQQNTVSTATNVSVVRLYPGTSYNLTVYETTGNMNSTQFPCCTWYSNSTGPIYPFGSAPTACGASVPYNCTGNSNTTSGSYTNILCTSRTFDIKNGRCA